MDTRQLGMNRSIRLICSRHILPRKSQFSWDIAQLECSIRRVPQIPQIGKVGMYPSSITQMRPLRQSFIWARPSSKTGVNTVLEIGTNQAEKQTRQLKQTD